jgi:hypothetical protein
VTFWSFTWSELFPGSGRATLTEKQVPGLIWNRLVILAKLIQHVVSEWHKYFHSGLFEAGIRLVSIRFASFRIVPGRRDASVHHLWQSGGSASR